MLLCGIVNGYLRKLSLKNLDREKIVDRFMYLRNSPGFKMSEHSKISSGVINRGHRSVQGFWHNHRGFYPEPLPEELEMLEKRSSTMSLDRVVAELGLVGVVRITQKLLEAQKNARKEAIAALPKPVRTPATE